MINALFLVSGLILGIVVLVLGICARAMADDDWDSTNFFNPLRALGLITIRPSWLAKMWYLTDEQVRILREAGKEPKRAYPYMNQDEYSEVVGHAMPPDDAA